jgi:hypothetical protein
MQLCRQPDLVGHAREGFADRNRNRRRYFTRNRHSLRHRVKKSSTASTVRSRLQRRSVLEQSSPRKVFSPANFLWHGRAVKLAADLRYGTGKPTDLPELRGLSDLGATSRRQGTAQVPVF